MKTFIRLIGVLALFGSVNVDAQDVILTWNSSGANTTFTFPNGATGITGTVWGGGGGGGGADYDWGGGFGAGGNSGAYVYHNNMGIGGGSAGISVAVGGSAGTGANNNPTAGGTGGTGTITYNGITLTATGGGGGGRGYGNNGSRSSTLGIASGGTTNINGYSYSNFNDGANAPNGGGKANSGGSSGKAGQNGNAPGGGAGGGNASNVGSTANGGQGATGRVVMTFHLPVSLAALNNRTQYCPDYPVKLYMAGNLYSNVTYQLYRDGSPVTTLDNTNSYSYETSTAGTYTVRATYKYNYTGTEPNLSCPGAYSYNMGNKTITMQSSGITVTAGSNCSPICTSAGTLLFRESFEKSNDPNTPSDLSNTLMYPGGCYLTQSYDTPDLNAGAWAVCDDHTYPNDPNKGYYLYVNIDDATGQPSVMFYKMTVQELCNDAKLTVSFWLANMVVLPEILQPNLEINVYKEGDADKTCLIEGGVYKTGKIQPGYTMNTQNRPVATWNKYFFPITLPAGVTSVVLEITNLETGGGGNDLLFDDFEVRFCTPTVDITSPSGATITGCGSVNLAGNYMDDGITFGNNLVGRWEYSTTGDVGNPIDWTPIDGTDKSSITGTIATDHTVFASGYYRFVVSNAGNINTYNCRAMSKVLQAIVHPIPAITTSANEICTGTLQMEATPLGGTWNSSNPAAATLSPAGVLTGISAGSTQITYSANGCTSSAKTITVKDCFVKVNPHIRVEIE